MEDRWSDAEAARCVDRYGAAWGEDLALRVYSSRLLGAEPGLVLHGGGNTSLKGTRRDLFGKERAALFVKASGRDLAAAEPQDHPAAGLAVLARLAREAAGEDGGLLDDVALRRALRSALFDPDAPTPSIEAPVHAVVPGRYVDHTHADAVLALSNRPDGEAVVREALGGEVIVLPYVTPGHELARAVAAALDAVPAPARPGGTRRGGEMVWLRHGVVTWDETAVAAYRRMIDLVTPRRGAPAPGRRRQRDGGGAGEARGTAGDEAGDRAERRWARLAPVLRGLLAAPSGDPDRPWRRVVLCADRGDEVRALLARPDVARLAAGGPLTADHLIRTKAEPLLVGSPSCRGTTPRAALATGSPPAVRDFATRYAEYVERHRGPAARRGRAPSTPRPRVVLLPGCGVVACGGDARQAQVALDVALHTLRVKAAVADAGARYAGLAEEHLFDMEYRPLQLAKLAPSAAAAPLAATVALVTGAAGAIGAGVCRRLLAAGAHVAATDLAGPALDSLAAELAADFPGRVLGVPLDVTDADGPAGVAAGFERVAAAWGGVDLVVVNAGAAHVARLEALELADFERLERINVHGTLLVLREAGRQLRRQGTGGDVVVVSTKNVFAPGASFSAYSATKAAAHQIARIASQELAELDVRVNMVAPDAVFGAGQRKSGLWQEVGPERMKARGLTEEGLEDYYRGRNLLKARVTADHVGRAVVFFASRQTPTTGATLPVDGGLPDATPR